MAAYLRQFLLLALAAVAAGTVSNLTAGSRRSLEWIGDWQVPDPPPVTPAPADGIEIGTGQAIAEHGKGTLFLDARPSESYDEGRIPGARAFAAWESETDQKIVDLMSEFPPDTRMVVYCTGGKCEDSHVVRGKLLSAGFTNVVVDRDGIPGWKAAEQPLEK
jgi:rhodanese-related sulfurtransferase